MSVQPETLLNKVGGDEDLVSNIPIYSLADLEELELERRVTLLRFSHQIGELLGTRLLGHFEPSGEPVSVSKRELKRIEDESIEAGLYISQQDSRYIESDDADQDFTSGLVTVRAGKGVAAARQLGLKLPFDLKLYGQPGVVFPPDEYPAIARSVKDLAKTSMTAQRAHLWKQNAELPKEERLTRKQINEGVKAKARAVLRGFVDRTKKLETEYIVDHDLLVKLRRQTRGLESGETKTPQNQYKAKNLAKELKLADEMFRETLEVAAIYNNWGDKQVQGAHRALTKVLYRGISPRENGIAWRRMTELQGQYINARRFKLLQARARCEQEIARHPRAPDAEQT